MRHELEVTMNIKACDIYGLSEVMGPGVAGEAVETQDGSHIWRTISALKSSTPSTPKSARKRAPRRRTRRTGVHVTDQGSAADHPVPHQGPHPPAPGHRPPRARRMGHITGRSDDMIILRGVNVFPSQIEEIALRIPEFSPHFQLELTRPEDQRMDQMTVKIERRETVSFNKAQRRRAPGAADQVHVGSSCRVDVDPGSLERSNGKLGGSTTCGPQQ